MTSAATTEPAGGGRSPESVDRLMVGVCGAVWLLFLVVGVIAAVACANLGRGRGGAAENPWLLYTVIAVSAATILGAVPLLLRARRDALAGRTGAEPQPASPRPAVTASAVEAPTEKIQVFGTAVDLARPEPEVRQATSASAGEVDRHWLRGTVSILGAMGLALTAVAAATYLLAVGSGTAAVVALVAAGAGTAAMIAAATVFSGRVAEALRAD